jgi:ribose transport system ATP-binding protein
MTPRLSAERVSKQFDGVRALDDVSVEFRAGEVHAVCGENGAGKSTLMRILCGAIADYDGRLLSRGKPVRFATPRAAEADGVAIVYQELHLAGPLSVAANVFLGRERLQFGFWRRDRAMEADAAKLFGRLHASIDPAARVDSLRVGDQQLVEIAKGLSRDADVLILDEPTSALAAAESERLFRIIEDHRRKGGTVVYISHKMDEIFRLADRITVLRDGRFVGTKSRSETTAAAITAMMVGRDLPPAAPRPPHETRRELLRVEGLTRPHPARAGVDVLSDVGFSMRRGEIVGVAGLLGAGRTELLECLFGAATNGFRGVVTLDGERFHPRSPAEAMRRGVALLAEDRKRLGLLAGRSVKENVSLARLDLVTAAGVLNLRRERRLVKESMERLRVKAPSLDAAVESLSGGNQQKCLLARWLLAKPTLLLLDEPTRGVDVGAKAEIHAHLRGLADEGIGVLMTSSELPELFAACDRILALSGGRLTGEFDPCAATEERLLTAMMERDGTA